MSGNQDQEHTNQKTTGYWFYLLKFAPIAAMYVIPVMFLVITEVERPGWFQKETVDGSFQKFLGNYLAMTAPVICTYMFRNIWVTYLIAVLVTPFLVAQLFFCIAL